MGSLFFSGLVALICWYLMVAKEQRAGLVGPSQRWFGMVCWNCHVYHCVFVLHLVDVTFPASCSELV